MKTMKTVKFALITLLMIGVSSCSNESIENTSEFENLDEKIKIYTFDESGNSIERTANLNDLTTSNTNDTEVDNSDERARKIRHRLTVKSPNNAGAVRLIQVNATENRRTRNVAGQGIGTVFLPNKIKFRYKTVGLHVSGNEKRAAFVGKITQILEGQPGAGVEVGNNIFLQFREASPNRFAFALTSGMNDKVAQNLINPGAEFGFGSLPLTKTSNATRVNARRTN